MAIPQKLEEYCEQFSEKLLSESFPSNGKITGEEILKFSTIKQVNLLIIKNLLIEWKRELRSLRSPYFDFESSEVNSALKEFANKLSRSILISKKDFHPLLLKSVREAISLMTTPYEFYMALANEIREKAYTAEDISDIAKYIKHNQYIYEDYSASMKDNGYKLEESSKVMEAVFNNTSESPEDLTEHLNTFSDFLPLHPEILIEGEPEEEASFELAEEESNDNVILNDKLKTEDSKSLADIHHEKKIDDLRASLNLNQRFMFINGLFDGDENKFNQTIEKLETLSSIADAKSFLIKEFNWDEEQEEVGEFFEILNKRLS